ncbi:ATP-binding protein [Candidatus Poribacteria bacterium]|nr:ATP-binding protein [Candidatus Poribacteria bacterium]MYH80787.1 ATP-binding protein [Candidatus Poribacteria bacterium]MYK93626.1 ATP-binding protein [Candidatus Poribacteria bacterium]
MRTFGTQGRVYPSRHYVVPRTEEKTEFIKRVKEGRYIVLFAPRQTGKTTFFRLALDTLATEEPSYFPIQLNFEEYEDYTASDFYANLYEDIREEIETVFQKREEAPPKALIQFLENTALTDHVSMRRFFTHFDSFLPDHSVILIIDEFDAIPREALKGFLHSLRRIYLTDENRCPHSVSIIGVKSITQLSYDRSVSPFNIQDEFNLPNFTFEQVRELLGQYTAEVGQTFEEEVIASIHRQTAGQPVLVNHFAEILTETLEIPKTEPITMAHFATAHTQLLEEDSVNLRHLLTNIRRDRRFETLLMKIASYDIGVRFTRRNEIMNELATYGVIKEGVDGMCEILNPIYHYCILQAFKPLVNGLENEYLPADNVAGFQDYLAPHGDIDMVTLLNNFKDFIARAGFRVLQVPDTPQEFIGQHLLLAYLDQFVQLVGGVMYLEVQTGRGRMDLLIYHNRKKYIVETKIWEGDRRYQAGKKQLAAYLKLEGTRQGYYIVFDHRQEPEPRVETETIEGITIRSYVIPVIQERPSDEHHSSRYK